MIKEKRIQTQKEEVSYEYFCDWCGKQITKEDYIYSPRHCIVCKKHACKNCNPVWHALYEWGDSSDYFCEECWNIGEPYRDIIRNAESDIDNARSEWWEKGKENANKEKNNG